MRRRPMQLLRRSVLLALLAVSLTGGAQASDPITFTIDGTPGTNGWYRGSSLGNFVRVRWSINVDVLDASKCGSPMQVAGPTTGSVATCTVTLTNGQPLTWKTPPIKIDADPPTGITAQLARPPDYNGWYNHPLGASWTASDATSGLASCTSLTYSGPDSTAAQLTGSCTDNAGNTASTSTALDYDATAPVLGKVRVDSKAGSDVVHWASTSAADTVVVQRWARGSDKQQTVFRGTGSAFDDGKVAPGLEYSYAVQTFDQAGNASKRIVVAGLPKVLLLGKTGYVPRAAAKPILRWNRVAGASYYNVQLYRGSKRIFAAWPAKNRLGLPAGWRWNGKRQRLSPGKYRWYVWAGFGARSFARYRTVGSAQFIVPA